MGQILHGTATTTHAVRAKIQASKESLVVLVKRYNINPKTVHKWRHRDSVEDQQCGKQPGAGSVLSAIDEQIIVETRRKTLLPLDDLLDALQPIIPVLTRSNLHRCLKRHGINRLSDLLPEEEKRKTKPFKDYAPGFLHIDTAQINLAKVKYYLFVAIDRATRFVYVELYDNKRMQTSSDFLQATLSQYPFKISKILADNGIEFSYDLLVESKKPKDKSVHPFVEICLQQGIEHRTTLVKHPWTNGMVEAMNKKIKTNTIKRFHYESCEQLKEHLYAYILNYNFKLNLRALGRKTPFDAILGFYEKPPSIFYENPIHFNWGLNIYRNP